MIQSDLVNWFKQFTKKIWLNWTIHSRIVHHYSGGDTDGSAVEAHISNDMWAGFYAPHHMHHITFSPEAKTTQFSSDKA